MSCFETNRQNQCASCHATNHTSGGSLPIGLKARHTNRTHPITGANQLDAWAANGWLKAHPGSEKAPANAAYDDVDASLDARARSYLDVKCGHCHNPQGAADTSGLMLDYQAHSERALGFCKPPIAAGRGSGGRLYSIVPGKPSESILNFRVASADPASMMPELGRALVHQEGVDLMDDWVAGLSGVCR